MSISAFNSFLILVVIVGLGLSCSQQQISENIVDEQTEEERFVREKEVLERQKQAQREMVIEEERQNREKALADVKQKKKRHKRLSNWIEVNFEQIRAKVEHYYCLEASTPQISKINSGSAGITAIVTDRPIVRFVDNLESGYRSSNNEYEIRTKIISPKRHRGKRIHFSAWRLYPGPEPTWIKAAEVGNLIELTFDRTHLKQLRGNGLLKLSLAEVNVLRHYTLCVLPEIWMADD